MHSFELILGAKGGDRRWKIDRTRRRPHVQTLSIAAGNGSLPVRAEGHRPDYSVMAKSSEKRTNRKMETTGERTKPAGDRVTASYIVGAAGWTSETRFGANISDM